MSPSNATSRRFAVGNFSRLVCFAIVLLASHAYADEYADVNVLIRAGKLAEAMAKADQYISGKPRDPQMRFIKGVIQTEAGKPADAIATFTQITQDYPELPEPYNNLAVLYASQSQFDKARAALEMAIRTNPSYATAHENLGDVYAKLASQAYSKALQLDSNNTGVQPKLALIRNLFAPETRGQRVGAAAPVPTAVAPTAPAAALGKPAATTAVAAATVGAQPAAAPTPSAATAGSAAATSGDKEIETAVRNWAAAWASKDMTGYLGSYGKDFNPPGQADRKAWEADRRSRIMGKSRITVQLSDVVVSLTAGKAMVKFKQAYSADGLNVTSRKTLEMVKAGERWVIVRETTG